MLCCYAVIYASIFLSAIASGYIVISPRDLESRVYSQPKYNTRKTSSSRGKTDNKSSYGINMDKSIHVKETPRTNEKLNPNANDKSNSAVDGVRLNKCLGTLSRRGADEAITEGRVSVNGDTVTQAGIKVKPGDKVYLDGKQQHWSRWEEAKTILPSKVLEDRDFVYLKYWKPVGITCTSDLKDDSNIIRAGQFHLFPQRLFTIGRLDKDSTGLILLTSDGRVNNAMLNPTTKKEKVYLVDVNTIPTDSQIQQLAQGVVITTTSQRENKKEITAKTRPCKVTRVGGSANSRRLEFILTEGRNRQIRKCCEKVGLTVVNLHRIIFAGIGMKGLGCGDWLELDEAEMVMIQSSLKDYQGTSSAHHVYDEME